MKKALFFLGFGLFLAVTGFPPLPATSFQAPVFKQEKLDIITISGPIPFTVEIADTEPKREYGFMNRTNIPDDHGMLFLVPHDTDISMWMKNTPMSLDMLFIDKIGQIVHIAPSTTPNSTDVIHANRPVHAVLELPAGTAAEQHIHLLDRVSSPRFAKP